jgi:hypothetical protein
MQDENGILCSYTRTEVFEAERLEEVVKTTVAHVEIELYTRLRYL